ncbi:MAG TPA: hypothetical protein VII75_13525 [Thermoanaerobaculia bacterium]|nr:hypothetical protein [Thermoanaerobaculia bacterium]
MSGHYVFNASAIGLGGVLTSPKRKVIPSLASVALAPTGGEGVGIVTNYDDGDGITFDRAETHVFGTSNGDGTYTTVADVMVNNLSVFNQLQVQAMRASVTSIRQVIDGMVFDRKFTFQAEYLGVYLNGQEMDLPVETKVFDDNPSYDDFVKALGTDEMADYRKLIGLDNAQAKSLVRSARAEDSATADSRTICCTAISPKCHAGFHVPVKGVGTAHLAEVLVKQGRRRLTLLRLELEPRELPHVGIAIKESKGLSNNGSMTVGSVEGNGTYTLP